MAHRHSGAKRQSDFPIFQYLEALNPGRLWADFQQMPRQQRWLVISIFASIVLSLVLVGIIRAGFNHYLETRGYFLYDALRSPYALEGRPLPVNPHEMQLATVLPAAVGGYQSQPLPTEEELAAIAQAEYEAFTRLFDTALIALRDYDAVAAAELAAAEAEAAALAAEAAAAAAESIIVDDEAAAEETQAEVVVAVDNMLERRQEAITAAIDSLNALTATLNRTHTIESALALPEMLAARQSFHRLDNLQVTLPEIAAVREGIAAASRVDTNPYTVSECLVLAENPVPAGEVRPCNLSLVPRYVEPAAYQLPGQNTQIGVTIAMFDNSYDATAAITDLFDHATITANTGNFTLGIVEIDYFFSRFSGTYHFAWSNENWVYVIAAHSLRDLEQFIAVFPH